MSSDVAQERLLRQRLWGRRFKRPEEAVKWLGAVQAQDYGAAKWGVGQRVDACADDDVDRAFDAGRILRTHVMRPTWHFVAPEDIRWLLQLTAPRVRQAIAYYDRKLELDESVFAAANAVIAEALEGGKYLTRPELAEKLGQAGIAATGQRLAHLVMRAELDAVICSGPRRGKQHTYALLDERAPGAKTLERDLALAELARRYFGSHGPALPQDFAKWSGLTVADGRHGIELLGSQLTRREIGGKTYWVGRSAPTDANGARRPTVHILPNYDEYLIAYRDYSPTADRSLSYEDASGSGVLDRHIIVVNGQVAGGWRRMLEKDHVVVEATLLVKLNARARADLVAAVEDYGRFLSVSAKLVVNEYAPV